MRVNPPNNSIDKDKKSSKAKRKQAGSSNGSKVNSDTWNGFMDMLGDVKLEQVEEEARRYLEYVLSAGNRFSRSPTHRNFQGYRDSLKKFLQFIEKGLYKIKEDMGMDADYPKLYMVAEKVDDKIHQLASLLMDNEKNTISFAGKVEEINGLVLDLYR
jgi:uncharacterized protein YaaR (DUF327 family)